MGARSMQMEGLPPKAQEFDLCIALTTQKYDWLMLGVFIGDTCEVSQESFGTGASQSGNTANQSV